MPGVGVWLLSREGGGSGGQVPGLEGHPGWVGQAQRQGGVSEERPGSCASL